jgi:hypothetical protein
MTTNRLSDGRHLDDPTRSDATERSPEDHLRDVRRRLLGVSHEQLADERRTYEKRKATIEARHRQR